MLAPISLHSLWSVFALVELIIKPAAVVSFLTRILIGA
jgi:hypothetical protein